MYLLPSISTPFSNSTRPFSCAFHLAKLAAATACSGSSRSAAELSPLLLDTQYHATRFEHSLVVRRFYHDFPTIFFCLPRSGPVFTDVPKSWKLLLPPGRVLQDVPERDFSVSWLHQALQGLNVQFHVGAIFQAMALFFTELHPTLCCSRPSYHHPSLPEANELCLHGAFHFLLFSSHRERLTTRKSLGPSVLKVSNVAHPFSSLASFRIRLKSTSTSSGPSRSSNSSTATFTLQLSSKYSFVLAMIFLSVALRRRRHHSFS